MSSARRFSFRVDPKHARKVNETLAEVRRLRVSAAIFTVALSAGAVALFALGELWSVIFGAVAIIGALGSAWITLWAPRKVGNIDALYANSPLVPAIVAQTRPRGATLLALIDIAKEPATAPVYALVTRNVSSLPGQRMQAGERVPAVAVLADRSTRAPGPTWEMVSPMPIAWGTADQAVLRGATKSIGDSEWTLLAKNISRHNEVGESRNRAIVLELSEIPPDLR